jgi:hypothetical protein
MVQHPGWLRRGQTWQQQDEYKTRDDTLHRGAPFYPQFEPTHDIRTCRWII